MRWDNEPIDSLCVCRVAFWNDGKIPITQDRLPSSDPLRIVANKPVRILSIETVNTSRSTLSFNYTMRTGTQDVLLSIDGGDALERNDGVAVRLLFEGDCQTTKFQVAGRVIGSSQLIDRTTTQDARQQSDSRTPWWLNVIMLVIVGSILSSVVFDLRSARPVVVKFLAIPTLMILYCVLIISVVRASFINGIPGWLPF
jgi:hypothetical protein